MAADASWVQSAVPFAGAIDGRQPRVDRSPPRARIAIGVLGAGVAWASLPFLAGLLGAVVLAVLLAPLQRGLAPRIGRRRAALLLAVASVVLGPLAIAYCLELLQLYETEYGAR